ncbi:MAG: hypothetical protein HPY50_12130 [Firmicutes bacterium]|nr:hypothetical protein [Bacillota bacterium]
MNEYKMPERDERTTAVENASLSFGYKLISFAILLDVMYRSLRLQESCWDLLGIVIGAGLAVTVYQSRYRIITRGWIRAAVLTAAAAAAVGAVLALVMLGR